MLFIDSVHGANYSDFVTEEIQPGEAVEVTANGLELVQGGGRFDGIAAGLESASWAADTDDDFRNSWSDFAYATTDDHPAPFGGAASGAELRMWTAKDNGTDPAANIGSWDVVGVPASGTLTTPNDSHFGRLVQEGYQDGASSPTTYSRSNGNFLPVGIALPADQNVPVNAFDELVHVAVRLDL